MLPGNPDSVEADPRGVTDRKKENVEKHGGKRKRNGKKEESRREGKVGRKIKRGEQSQRVSR